MIDILQKKWVSSQLSIKKTLYLEDLFKGLTDKNKRCLKNNIIQQFDHLKKGSFIEKEFEFLQSDGQIVREDHITNQLLESSTLLIFYENLKNNEKSYVSIVLQ